MADISLRAYIREIDGIIDGERFEEAISHCRHILKKYPKHLDTYRLLGKAFLEAKKYSDATDIFQRVLSALPGDFVSHIGMAIIREDEGNLDAAIWHMERAFETSPANQAIQQEMRRLLGARDGVEPPKVRLTRGALAHMYARGELYLQAVSELVSTLDEDSDRPDLQALLAEMYWRTRQRVEAAHVCTTLLEKLPYCRDANRIMAAILQAGDQADEAQIYHLRLADLDPYAALVENATIDPKTIDDGAIRIKKLDWRPGMTLPTSEPGGQDWATSLGLDLAKEAEDTPRSGEPSWLGALSATAMPVEEIEEPAQAAESDAGPIQEAAGQDDIPTWIREAGWQESTGEAQDGPVVFSDSELDRLDAGLPPDVEAADDDEPIVPADIPDWIMDIAPTDEPFVEEPPLATDEDEDDDSQLPDWLKDISPEQYVQETAAADDAEPAAEIGGVQPEAEEVISEAEPTKTGTRELPSWLDEGEPGASETIVSWLGKRDEFEEDPEAEPTLDLKDEETPSEEVISAEAETSEEEGLPGWLSALASAPTEDITPDTAQVDEADLPAPIADLEIQPSEAELDEPTLISDAVGAPTESPAPEPIPAVPEQADDTLSWLHEFAPENDDADETVDEPITEAAPEVELEPQAADQVPLEDEHPAQVQPEEAVESLEGTLDEADIELPSPTEDLDISLEGEVEAPAAEGVTPEAEPEISLDWLDEAAVEDTLEAETEPAAAQPDVPDWLQDLASEAADEPLSIDEISEVGQTIQGEQPDSESDWFLAGEPAPSDTRPTGAPGVTDWLRTTKPQVTHPEEEAPQTGEPAMPGIDAIEATPGEPAPPDLETFETPHEEPAAPEIEAVATPADTTEAPEIEAIETPAETPAALEPETAEAQPHEPAAEPVPAPDAVALDPGEALQEARQALREGNLDQAATIYSDLIKRRIALPAVIEDLANAVKDEPGQPEVWQTLGDAYMKADRIGEALDAYQRGLEVV